MKKIMMKQLYVALFLVLSSCVFNGYAQQADQRTWDTKVADIVMLLPAKDTQTLNQLMGELNSLGGDVVPYMSSMLTEPGKGDDSKIRYAIAGLSFYVSLSGKEKDKQVVAAGFCKSIEKTGSQEIRRFLLTQLQYVAGEESVGSVKALLNNASLCDPAVRVLVRINTPSAKESLLTALKSASGDDFRIALVGGLGDIRYSAAAGTLEKMISTSNPNLKHIVMQALAEIAAPSSQKVLEKALQQSGYVFNATDAEGAYILYLSNLLKNGGNKAVSKAAKDLMSKASTPQMIAAKSAGLSLYALSEKENAIPEIIKALDNTDKTYRGTALAAAMNIKSPAMTKALLDRAGKENNYETKAEIIYALGYIGDKSAISFVESNINAGNALVKNAAIVTLGKLNGENDFGKIIQEMNVNNDQIIATAKQALLTISNPQMITQITSAIPQANPSAQIAMIDILSQRKALNGAEAVFAQANSSNPDVKLAAEQALKNLSQEKDLIRLSSLLNKASGEKDILALQEAIYSAVKNSGNADKQTDLIMGTLKSSAKPELYYNVLAMIGGKKGLDIVKDAFNKGNVSSKDLSFKALASWSDFSTAPTLFEIAKSNPSGAYFDKALTSFVNKINSSDNSPEQKSRYLSQALEIAKTSAQKSGVVEELAKTGTFSALNVVGTYLGNADSKLQQAAVQAVYKIVLSNNEVYGETVKPLIDKAISVNKDPEAEYQKQAILKQMVAWPKEGGAVKYEVSTEEAKEGFIPMFNGIDMTGWTGNLKDYVAQNGMIICDPKYGGRGNLYTEKEYSDFIMRFDFLLTPAANNGLGIRTPLEGDAAYVGMELQILDNTAEVYKNLKEYQYHGSVYGIIAAKKGALNPVGEWNTEEVIAKGNRIKVIVNGVVIVDGDIAKASKNFTVMPDGKEHPGLSNKKGHIGFLGHGSYVSFKNLRIKDLSGEK